MDVFERIRYARKQRDFTQETVASWFGLTGAAYGRKERGKEGGLDPDKMKTLVERFQVDARYFFGQIDSWEEADLRNPNRNKVAPEILEALRPKDPELAPALMKLIGRIRVNSALREHVERLAYEPGDFVAEVDEYAQFKMSKRERDRSSAASE